MQQQPFIKYIRSAENKKFWYAALVISIIYFVALRFLYPTPVFTGDSAEYISVAAYGNQVTARPLQYGELIHFFSLFSVSDICLIAAQYFSSVLANLFLFFTATYFFSFRKYNKSLLFLLLLCNPLYIFTSNFVLSDPFFCSFTVAWFGVLVWIMYKPRWYFNVLQLILLSLLFRLRYNAIIFPVTTSMVLLLSPLKLWKKLGYILLNFLLIGFWIINISNNTRALTGVRTFSAFGGWQLANNAMYVLKHDRNIDTNNISDPEVKKFLRYTTHYLDTATYYPYDTVSINGEYMWNLKSPLYTYHDVYIKEHNDRYGWTALGPVCSDFGKTIIKQHPLLYLKYFVIPNAKTYFFSPLEAYGKYGWIMDSIEPYQKDYFHYKSSAPDPRHYWVYRFFFKPWTTLFPLINILFIVLAAGYFFSKKYKRQPEFLNKIVLCFGLFFLANFFFIAFLAPSTFRYNVFIVVLLMPALIAFLQQLLSPVQQDFGRLPVDKE